MKAITTCLPLLWAMMGLSGCFGLGGSSDSGSSETENSIAGVVRDGGNPVPGAEIILLPSDYDPLLDAGDSLLKYASTDAMGHYELGDILPGTYNLLASGPRSSKSALIQSIIIEANSGEVTVDAFLKDPGTLSVPLAGVQTGGESYVYIPGTTLLIPVTAIDILAGTLVFSGIPTAVYTTINYWTEIEAKSQDFAAVPVEIFSSDTAVVDPWWNSQKIVVNAALSGVVTEDVHHFPLLIRLDASNFEFSSARPGGDDLRFSRGNQVLDYEIETWDSTEASVWVLMDTIFANDSAQTLTAYWGNARAPAASNGAGVYSASDYVGVYHFNQDPAGPAPQMPDASANANHGTARGGMTAASLRPGLSGNSLQFDGAANYVSTGQPQDNPSVFTLSLWFNTTTTRGGKLIGFGYDEVGASQWWDRHIWMSNDGRLHFGVFPHLLSYGPVSPQDSSFIGLWDTTGQSDEYKLAWPGIRRTLSTSDPYNDGQWHHAVAVLSPAGQHFYVDGQWVGSRTDVTSAQNFVGYWRMGYDEMASWENDPPSDFFAGLLDEVRIRYRAESPEWIRLSFETQRPNQAVVYPSN